MERPQRGNRSIDRRTFLWFAVVAPIPLLFASGCAGQSPNDKNHVEVIGTPPPLLTNENQGPLPTQEFFGTGNKAVIRIVFSPNFEELEKKRPWLKTYLDTLRQISSKEMPPYLVMESGPTSENNSNYPQDVTPLTQVYFPLGRSKKGQEVFVFATRQQSNPEEPPQLRVGLVEIEPVEVADVLLVAVKEKVSPPFARRDIETFGKRETYNVGIRQLWSMVNVQALPPNQVNDMNKELSYGPWPNVIRKNGFGGKNNATIYEAFPLPEKQMPMPTTAAPRAISKGGSTLPTTI